MEQDKKIMARVRGVIIHENKLLVVKHAPESNFTALPGGHLEFKENIKECLSRELIEELGIKPEIGRLLYVNNFVENDSQSIEFFFEINNSHEYLNLENLERTHAHEISEIKWVKSTDDISIRPKEFEEDFKLNKILSSDEVKFINLN